MSFFSLAASSNGLVYVRLQFEKNRQSGTSRSIVLFMLWHTRASNWDFSYNSKQLQQWRTMLLSRFSASVSSEFLTHITKIYIRYARVVWFSQFQASYLMLSRDRSENETIGKLSLQLYPSKQTLPNRCIFLSQLPPPSTGRFSSEIFFIAAKVISTCLKASTSAQVEHRIFFVYLSQATNFSFFWIWFRLVSQHMYTHEAKLLKVLLDGMSEALKYHFKSVLLVKW